MKIISKAIVTGGAGFIGSHIVDELLNRKIETFVIDDFSTGSMANLASHEGNKLLHVRKGNVRDIQTVFSDISGIDTVFHEAAIASVPKSVEDPLLVHEVNVDYSLKLLDYCLKQKVRKIIFASSAAVYGQIEKPPAREDMHCRPASPYGASKLAIEDYFSAYYNSYKLDTVALRYFNVFGPRQKKSSYSGVITIFIKDLLSGNSPTIFGDGMQTRDFVHVRDIARANMLAMESDKAAGDIFNVASGRAISILELLEVIKGVTRAKTAKPKFASAASGDVRIGTASIQKIKRVLGYSPSVTLDEGLAELVRLASSTESEKA